MNILQLRGKNKKRLFCQRRVERDNFKTCYFVISFVAIVTFVFPSISEAYLDPGTGSFIFQMIIASFIGGLYTIKTYWRNNIKFFKKNKKE